MNFNEFTDKVVESITNSVKNVSINTITVDKNNGLTLTGIVIVDETNKSNMHPTIYLEKFYEQYSYGRNFDEIINEISEIYSESKNNFISFDTNIFSDYNVIKKGLTVRLINYEKNAERLKTIPYKMFNDLAIICVYVVGIDDEGQGTVTITNKHLNNLNVTKDELFNDALNNLNNSLFIASDIGSVLSNMGFDMGFDSDAADISSNVLMYVVTNKSKVYGAATMLNKKAMEEVYNHFIDDFYIIPSSVHEIIAIPKNDKLAVSYIKDMVKEVNQTQLSPEEVLSDSVYLYDSATGDISIV